MSLNWVMVSPRTNPPFTPLPNEQLKYKAPPRVDISIRTPSQNAAKQQKPFELAHKSGSLYLTNQRVIYLPDKSSNQLQSFAAPILNLHDSHPTMPWFGANTWTAHMEPVQGGGVPVSGGLKELKFTFNEGGVNDFHTSYEQARERLLHAVEMARNNGSGPDRSRPGRMVDLASVNLEDLPPYSEESDGPLIAPTAAAIHAMQSVSPAAQSTRDSGVGMEDHRRQPKPGHNSANPPDEPPPGYEESQMAGLQDEVEQRQREQ